MTQALGLVCVLQKTYGKTPKELELLTEGYLWALEGYSFEQIMNAIKTYILQKSDIPTPSDIIKIIEPPKQIISSTMYQKLLNEKKNDAFMSKKELEAMRLYEQHQLGEE